MLKIIGFLTGIALTATFLTGNLDLSRLENIGSVVWESVQSSPQTLSALAFRQERQALRSEPAPMAVRPVTNPDPDPGSNPDKAAMLDPIQPTPSPLEMKTLGEQPVNQDTSKITVAAGEEETTTRLYPFWSPFHSETSARGFIQRMAKVTGYRFFVTRPPDGNYQVAFTYSDEKERLAVLQAIQAHTGLSPIGEPPMALQSH
ncbi:MAG: hypothetical protein GY731_12140 [Gammaproteobacteria bacterium]|nr:hypothetical protein [Gammaproteobacteria bacterium]